jgi:hypothetical protein
MDLKVQGSTHVGRALESVIPLKAGPNRTISLDQGQNRENIINKLKIIISYLMNLFTNINN